MGKLYLIKVNLYYVQTCYLFNQHHSMRLYIPSFLSASCFHSNMYFLLLSQIFPISRSSLQSTVKRDSGDNERRCRGWQNSSRKYLSKFSSSKNSINLEIFWHSVLRFLEMLLVCQSDDDNKKVLCLLIKYFEGRCHFMFAFKANYNDNHLICRDSKCPTKPSSFESKKSSALNQVMVRSWKSNYFIFINCLLSTT